MTTRNLAKPVQEQPRQAFLLRAQPEVSALEKVGDRTMRGTFFTDRAVIRYDWWEGTEYELQFSPDPDDWNLERANNGVVTLLDNHYGVRLGLVTKVEIDGKGGGTFEATLSRNPQGDAALNDFEDGIFGGISFGSVVGRMEEIKPAEYSGIGRNRKLVSVQVMMAKDIELMEISRADIPANPEAIARLHLEMKSLKETMSGSQSRQSKPEVEQEDAGDELATLKAELAASKAEAQRLSAQLAEQASKLSLQNKYTEIRQKAEKLKGEAKISIPEFSAVFGADANADIQELSALSADDQKDRLTGMSFWLTQAEKRSPLLSLGATSASESEAIADPQTTSAPNGDGGATGKEYMKSYTPKPLY